MARLRGIKQPHPLGSVASRVGVSPLSVVSVSSASTGVKISELPAASAASATDLVEVSEAGSAYVSKRVTLDQVATLVAASDQVSDALPFIDVRDYGATGDGVADDTTAINDALTACNAAGGGVVFMPAGTYRTTAPIAITGNGIRLLGESSYSTTITSSAAAGHVITMSGGSSCSVENLRIIASVVKSTGTAAIYTTNHHNCGVFHVVIGNGSSDANMYTGVQIEAGAEQFIFELSDFEIGGGRYGIVVGDEGVLVQDVTVQNGTIYGATIAGILLRDASGLFFSDLDVGVCGIGVRFYPDTGKQVAAGFFDSVATDTCTTWGWKIETNGGFVNGHVFSQIWACGNGTTTSHNGVLIDAGTGNLACLRFTAPIVQANAGSGFRLTECVDVQIVNALIACNSQAANNTKHGIEVEANVSEWEVLGGSCNGYGISSTNKQAYGISIAAGTSNHYVIEGVNVGNNLSGGILDSAAGSTRRIANNIGYTLDVTGGGTLLGALTGTSAAFSTNAQIGTLGSSNRLDVRGTNGVDSFIVLNTSGTKFFTVKPESSTDTTSMGYWTGSGFGTLALSGPMTGTTASYTSVVTTMSATAVAAGANTQAFVKASSTANLGLYYGTGNPAFSAAKGSLYTKTDATTTTTRLWVNTDGSTTWTNFTSAA